MEKGTSFDYLTCRDCGIRFTCSLTRSGICTYGNYESAGRTIRELKKCYCDKCGSKQPRFDICNTSTLDNPSKVYVDINLV